MHPVYITPERVELVLLTLQRLYRATGAPVPTKFVISRTGLPKRVVLAILKQNASYYMSDHHESLCIPRSVE